ncbi:MAG: hypothetical protein ACOY3U_08015 [Bacillota bacterium]
MTGVYQAYPLRFRKQLIGDAVGMRLHKRMVRENFWNDPDLLQQPQELR